IASSIPPLETDDPTGKATVLVLGWGSTYGSIGAAVRRARRAGHQGAQAAPRPLNPVPAHPGDPLRRHAQGLRSEVNTGPRAPPRPVGAAAARPLPDRRDLVQPRSRPAVPCG